MKKLLFVAALLVQFSAFADIQPSVDPANVTTATPICLGNSYMLYRVGITDADLDFVSVSLTVSSDNSIMDGSLVDMFQTNVVGPITYFEFYGTPTLAGTFDLTITFFDGTYYVSETLPQITVIDAAGVDFLVPEIKVCSNQGIVNLNEYVSIPGGEFFINSLEINYPDGLFDSGNSGLPLDESYTINYSVMSGNCHFQAEASIILHESQPIAVTTTPASCGDEDGTASFDAASVNVPYSFVQWSSGHLNTENVSDLAAGAYSLAVTFDNGCISNNYFSIPSAAGQLTAAIQDADCHGAATGSITLTIPAGVTAPVTALWSSGHSTTNLTNMPAGVYTVQVSDANDCILTENFTIGQPDALIVEAGVSSTPTCGGTDGIIEVFGTSGGVEPYTYEWSNNDEGTMASNIEFGIYSLTTTDGNGCITVNTLYVSENGAADLYGMVTPSSCGLAEGAITTTLYPPFGETISSISWSNGATSQDVSSLLPQLYTCTLVASNNCRSIKGWNVPVGPPLRNDICVVTVDSATTTNLVVWEKVQTTGISHYNIYRETSMQGNFALIDTVNADNISLFNDVVASPLDRSWRYKISAVNTCNVESPLSNPHQTIHMQMVGAAGGTSVDLSWNPYEGAAFSNYYVYRYTTATGVWESIAELPATQLTYTDNTPPATPGLDYMVEMERDDTCTALIYRAQDFNSSRSNKDKAQFNPGHGTGDSHNGIAEIYLGAIRVYPNPASDLITIDQESNETITIEIRSVEGQLIQTLQTAKLSQEIRIDALSSGVYFVTVSLDGVQETKRIIKR